MSLKRITLVLMLLLALSATAVLAQEGDPRDRTLTVDDFSLTFHRAIVRNANVSEYAGDDPAIGPGFSDAPHVDITLYNEMGLPDRVFATVASVRLYEMAALQDYPFLMEQADALNALLDERPDLATFTSVEAIEGGNTLPFVPVLPHGQLIRARAQYVETDEVLGISYLFYSNAAREPFFSTSFTYTFQGVTTDGKYYISAQMPLVTSLFPDMASYTYDPVAFEAEYPQYLAESIETLNNALPEDFTPALGVLDGLVQTFRVEE